MTIEINISDDLVEQFKDQLLVLDIGFDKEIEAIEDEHSEDFENLPEWFLHSFRVRARHLISDKEDWVFRVLGGLPRKDQEHLFGLFWPYVEDDVAISSNDSIPQILDVLSNVGLHYEGHNLLDWMLEELEAKEFAKVKRAA